MKFIITCFICCIALLRVDAADDSLIPAPLNSVLLKIQPGMTTNQVLAVLSPSYPKVEVHMGMWSGQTGYMDYKLDERFTLSVSSVMQDGKELVHDDLLFYVFDWQTKRRIDIKLYYWDGRSETTNSFGIYLTAEPIDQRIFAYGKGDLSRVRLSESPVISASDIISYNFAEHSMKLRPEALARIPRPSVEGTLFVVVADGERIYLGAFTTIFSSMGPHPVPCIEVDGRVFDTNQPADTLVIYQGTGSDPRGDPRIKTALKELHKLKSDE